jgi:5-formyltetrahydrofolate cyclo-ligase
MNSGISKQELRESIRARLKLLSEAKHALASQGARDLLEKQGTWKQAKTILFYAPLPGELDIWPLFQDAIQAGKETCLPRFTGQKPHPYIACAIKDLAKDLKTGQFSIREPVDGALEIPLNRLDFVLVPGIAFDLQGRRLGRGKGYYDRLLAEVHGKTCGVAFDEQIVEVLPVEPHDIHVNCILTPTRWIEL